MGRHFQQIEKSVPNFMEKYDRYRACDCITTAYARRRASLWSRIDKFFHKLITKGDALIFGSVKSVIASTGRKA